MIDNFEFHRIAVHKKYRLLALLVCSCVLLLSLAGCSSKKEKKGPEGPTKTIDLAENVKAKVKTDKVAAKADGAKAAVEVKDAGAKDGDTESQNAAAEAKVAEERADEANVKPVEDGSQEAGKQEEGEDFELGESGDGPDSVAENAPIKEPEILDVISENFDNPKHLSVASFLPPRLIRETTHYTGVLTRARLAGASPSAKYNYVRWYRSARAGAKRAHLSEDLGLVLQMWKLDSAQEATQLFSRRYEQSFGGKVIRLIEMQSFIAHHHGLIELCFVPAGSNHVLTLTCVEGFCTDDQVMDLAEDITKMLIK